MRNACRGRRVEYGPDWRTNVRNGSITDASKAQKKSCPTAASLCLAHLEPSLHSQEATPVILCSRPVRPCRSGEWTQGRAVTFIVTLAATRSVTLAARAAGMSRKAAYALKSRDSAFASAWNAAIAANGLCGARVTKWTKWTNPGFDGVRVTNIFPVSTPSSAMNSSRR